MNNAARVALLVIALALLLGCIYAAWQRDVYAAIISGALAATCGVFERIIAVHGNPPDDPE